MGVRGSNDDEAEDYARIDREALDLLKGAGPVEVARALAVHTAQEVALASRPRGQASGAGSRPVAPFIGPRRKPKAWGRIGSTALGGPAFTKHTHDEVDAVMLPGEYIVPSGPSMPAEEHEELAERIRRAGDKPPTFHTGGIAGPGSGASPLAALPCFIVPAHRLLSDEELARKLEELNRKPGRLANLDLRGL